MPEDATTDGANSNEDVDATTTSETTSTDNQTTDNGDNLDTSTSTDAKVDDDKSDTTDKEEDSAPTFDEDLDEWAEKTNRSVPTTDRERQLYQEIRNQAREFGKSKQAKEALKGVGDAIKDNNPNADDATKDSLDLGDTVSQLERQVAGERALRVRSEYFSEKGVTADESKAMGEILKEKLDRISDPKRKQAVFDYWTDTDNLADWHDLAKARLVSGRDDSQLVGEIERQTKARIAKESQAASTTRGAKSTITQAEKTDDERRLDLWDNPK